MILRVLAPRGWIAKFEFIPSHLNIRLWPLIVVGCTCHVVFVAFVFDWCCIFQRCCCCLLACRRTDTIIFNGMRYRSIKESLWGCLGQFKGNQIIFVCLLQFVCFYLLLVFYFCFCFACCCIFQRLFLLLACCLLAGVHAAFYGMWHRSIKESSWDCLDQFKDNQFLFVCLFVCLFVTICLFLLAAFFFFCFACCCFFF